MREKEKKKDFNKSNLLSSSKEVRASYDYDYIPLAAAVAAVVVAGATNKYYLNNNRNKK